MQAFTVQTNEIISTWGRRDLRRGLEGQSVDPGFTKTKGLSGAEELLDRQAAAERASENIIAVITMQQPPPYLLISITPGVRELAQAAASL